MAALRSSNSSSSSHCLRPTQQAPRALRPAAAGALRLQQVRAHGPRRALQLLPLWLQRCRPRCSRRPVPRGRRAPRTRACPVAACATTAALWAAQRVWGHPRCSTRAPMQAAVRAWPAAISAGLARPMGGRGAAQAWRVACRTAVWPGGRGRAARGWGLGQWGCAPAQGARRRQCRATRWPASSSTASSLATRRSGSRCACACMHALGSHIDGARLHPRAHAHADGCTERSCMWACVGVWATGSAPQQRACPAKAAAGQAQVSMQGGGVRAGAAADLALRRQRQRVTSPSVAWTQPAHVSAFTTPLIDFDLPSGAADPGGHACTQLCACLVPAPACVAAAKPCYLSACTQSIGLRTTVGAADPQWLCTAMDCLPFLHTVLCPPTDPSVNTKLSLPPMHAHVHPMFCLRNHPV